MEIAELIAKLDRASGPDRELDAGIWEHLGLAPKYDNSKNNYGHWHYRGGGDYHYSDDSPWGRNQLAPFYTSSIDAAMTLVPDGYGWSVSQPNATALASGLLKKNTPVTAEVQHGIGSRYVVAGATPAIALCIAALKARAQIAGA